MRLPILDPSGLSDEQKPLYKDMRAGIGSHFRGFVNTRPDGALLGPSGIPGQANRISVSRFGNWLRQWFRIRRCQRRCARSQSWLRDLTFVRAASYMRTSWSLNSAGYRMKNWARLLLGKGLWI